MTGDLEIRRFMIYFSRGLRWASLTWSRCLHPCSSTIHSPPHTQVTFQRCNLHHSAYNPPRAWVKSQTPSLLTRPCPVSHPPWLEHQPGSSAFGTPYQLLSLIFVWSMSFIRFSASMSLLQRSQPPAPNLYPLSLLHFLHCSHYDDLTLFYTHIVLFKCHHAIVNSITWFPPSPHHLTMCFGDLPMSDLIDLLHSS